ncbi:hypothetical protein VTO73DRAFT_4292 [Trametes versicolor]
MVTPSSPEGRAARAQRRPANVRRVRRRPSGARIEPRKQPPPTRSSNSVAQAAPRIDRDEMPACNRRRVRSPEAGDGGDSGSGAASKSFEDAADSDVLGILTCTHHAANSPRATTLPLPAPSLTAGARLARPLRRDAH